MMIKTAAATPTPMPACAAVLREVCAVAGLDKEFDVGVDVPVIMVAWPVVSVLAVGVEVGW